MSFSIKQIQYFLATADAGQLSQAAVDLNVSQSAITTALKNLEERLGVLLFERHAHGVSLTQAGHQFLQHARNINAAVEEALHSPQQYQLNVSGEMSVAVTYTVAGYFLPQHVVRFSRRYPGVTLNLFEATRDEIEEGIISNRFQLGVLLTSNLVNQEDIEYETLFRSRRRLWLASNHELLNRASVSLRDVAQEPYIMLTVDEASNTAHRYWNKTPYIPKVTFATSSVEAVRSMVAMGMGVTVLSDMVYRPWSLEGRRIETLVLENEIPSMDVGIAWRKRSDLSPAAQAFIDYFHLAFNQPGPP
ncbi:MAG: LysR family transcriptional regulator [Proteobacteria bacterium]|nr:MAG: LysR family transcriptional regulator [Pseudomonadota bacterium]